MSDTQLPRTATWLLTELGPAEPDEAFLGDLAEEYARRQSDRWYFKEVVSALLVGAWNDVTHYPWAIAIAVLTGWILLAAWFAFIALFLLLSAVPGMGRLFGIGVPILLPSLSVWLMAPAFSGLTISYLFGRVRLAALLAMAMSIFLAGFVFAGVSLSASSRPGQAWMLGIGVVAYCNFIALWVAGTGMLGPRSRNDFGFAIAEAAGERFDRVMNILRPMRDL